SFEVRRDDGALTLTSDSGAGALVRFPLGQTLAAAGEEYADRMVGPGNTLTELEVPLHELHRLDVRQEAEDRPPEPLPRRRELAAPEQRLKRLRDPQLQPDRRH